MIKCVECGFLSATVDPNKGRRCVDCRVAKLRNLLPEVGGTKHDSDKPDLSLLPFDALIEVARVLEFGAKKYGRDNWRKGLEPHRLTAAALRHTGRTTEGEEIDPESGLLHDAHTAANMLFRIWLRKNGEKK